MDISIITFTMGGRDRYLAQCMDSIYDDICGQLIRNENKIEHHVVLQGIHTDAIQCVLNYFDSTQECYKLIVHEWPENIGIGAGLNKIIPQCTAPLIMKMDDDCKIVSKDFFESATRIHNRFPNSVFSPFPVGLIRSLGGVPGFKHSVWYDKHNNRYYTKRHVSHVGGFARFAPANIMRNFKFAPDLIPGQSGNEDGQFSSYCGANNIEMFYLENDMVVEHNESGFGQILRYPEYFTGRSWESTVKIEVIE